MGLLHQFLHAPVPDHEVGGRSVLIDQQNLGPQFQGFHDIGGLGGAAAGIVGTETERIPQQGKGFDKRADIDFFHKPSIFGPDLDRRRIGDHVFPTVSRDMAVNPQFQGPQKG